MTKTNLIQLISILLFFLFSNCTQNDPIINNQVNTKQIEQDKKNKSTQFPGTDLFKIGSIKNIAIEGHVITYSINILSRNITNFDIPIQIQTIKDEKVIAEAIVKKQQYQFQNNQIQFHYVIDTLEIPFDETINLTHKISFKHQNSPLQFIETTTIEPPIIKFLEVKNESTSYGKNNFIFYYQIENQYNFELNFDQINLMIVDHQYSTRVDAKILANQTQLIKIPLSVNLIDFYENGIEFYHRLPIQIKTQLSIPNFFFELEQETQIILDLDAIDQSISFLSE